MVGSRAGSVVFEVSAFSFFIFTYVNFLFIFYSLYFNSHHTRAVIRPTAAISERETITEVFQTVKSYIFLFFALEANSSGMISVYFKLPPKRPTLWPPLS